MKLKYCLLLIPCFISVILLQAQQKNITAPLHIGSSLPAVKVQYLDNSAAILGASKNKIIILDFFSTICGACISSLPRLNMLQQQNAGMLQIILVANEPANITKAFFNTNRFGKENKLPIVVSNNELSKLFPHTLLPHDVWINKNGIVQAITAGDAITQDNITALINNQSLNLPLKEDLLDFDAAKPLFDSGNGVNTDKIFFRSTFSQAISGVESKVAIYTSTASKRFLCLNQPLQGLYQEALGSLPSNKILLRLKDESLAKAFYCYELLAPQNTEVATMHQLLLQDVERCFNIKGSYQQQLMDCYTLSLNANDSVLSAGENRQIFFVEDSVTFSKPFSLAGLTDALNEAAKNATTIFSTKDNDNSFNLPAILTINLTKVKTTADLQKQLLPYGISLKLTQQLLDMFVITDTNTSQTIVQNQ